MKGTLTIVIDTDEIKDYDAKNEEENVKAFIINEMQEKLYDLSGTRKEIKEKIRFSP